MRELRRVSIRRATSKADFSMSKVTTNDSRSATPGLRMRTVAGRRPLVSSGTAMASTSAMSSVARVQRLVEQQPDDEERERQRRRRNPALHGAVPFTGTLAGATTGLGTCVAPITALR
jgi:hypothetical protein